MRKTKFLTFIFLTCIVLFCFCSCTNTEDSTKIVKLNKENVTVSVFEIVTLTTTTENITENIVWSSSDETVATVTNGIVTANKAGNVIVTASAEGVYASAKVTFTEIDSSKLTIVNEYVTLEIAEGESERLFSNVLFNEKFVDGGMFNYVTQNTSIAEISKDGTLSALSAGETTVTINGSIKGYTLAPVTFNVKVIENINLVTNLENDRITLYLSNGINNDYITEYTISPTVTVAGEIVNNATFDYKNNNETVIDFSNGVIVARAVGATAVDISYTSKKGTIVKKTVSVVVIKPRTEILKDSEILMGIKTENDLSVFGIRDEIKSFMVNGKKTTINVSGNSFTFNDDLTDGLSANIVIETDNEIFTFTADVYDYVVGSKEDFRAFGKNILIDSGTSVALTANINYEGGNFFNDSGFNDSCFYSGVLDGKGYTVSNVKGTNGFFYGLKNATVKNIGFKNLVRDTYNGGGSLANEMLGNNFIENVYIDVKFTAYSGDYLAGVASICEGTFKNVVIIVDFQSNPGKYNAIGRSYNTAPSLEHCYAVSANSSGYMFGAVTEGLYTDEISFAAASINLINNFDLNFWTVSGGKMTFKTAA